MTERPGNITLTDFYTRPRYSRTPEDFGTEKVNYISIDSQNILDSGNKFSNVFKFEDKDQTTSALSGGRYILAKTNLETSTFSSKLIKKYKITKLNLKTKCVVDFFK